MGGTLRVVAGIGCRRGVTAEQVEAGLTAAIATAGHLTLSHIATPASKGHEPAVKAAADARGIPLVLIPQVDLEANNAKTVTRSINSMKAMNVHSVAEAAALAGAAAQAGAGEQSRLLGPRIAVGPVTCALATTQLGTGSPQHVAASGQPAAGPGQPAMARGSPATEPGDPAARRNAADNTEGGNT